VTVSENAGESAGLSGSSVVSDLKILEMAHDWSAPSVAT
jgi:hypothetical protein